MNVILSADEPTGTTRLQEDEAIDYFQVLNPHGVDFEVLEAPDENTEENPLARDFPAFGSRSIKRV